MQFELTKEQIKKLREWKNSLPKIPNNVAGTIGGDYTYSFTPTGLGDILVIKRIDGHEINLTDFENW